MKDFHLSKAITTHGPNGATQMTVLALKEPTGDLVFEHGLPFTSIVDNDTKTGRQRIEVKMEPAVFKIYISRMTGLDGGVIGQLAIGDIMHLFNATMEVVNGVGNSAAPPTI